jgi:multidrug efflux pump subunit AcrB
MPPGTISPFVMRFDVGSIPVGYLVLKSETKTIGEIQDQALFKVRPMFASLPGVSAPPPFGGNQRTVVVRVDPDRLRSYQMSPDEVIGALSAGNFISPSGNVRIGNTMPIVPINSLVRQVKDLEAIPIRPGQDPSVYIRDVGTVHDATDIPSGYALANGRRAVYILVTKRADASTLSVVNNVKKALPSMQAVLPDDISVGPDRGDGAPLPARLAERHRRRAQHPVRPLRRRGRPVAHRADDQPDDTRRPRAGHRHPGR